MSLFLLLLSSWLDSRADETLGACYVLTAMRNGNKLYTPAHPNNWGSKRQTWSSPPAHWTKPPPPKVIHSQTSSASLRLSGLSLESILCLSHFCSYPYRKHDSEGGSQGPHSYWCVPTISLASCDDTTGNTIRVDFNFLSPRSCFLIPYETKISKLLDGFSQKEKLSYI